MRTERIIIQYKSVYVDVKGSEEEEPEEKLGDINCTWRFTKVPVNESSSLLGCFAMSTGQQLPYPTTTCITNLPAIPERPLPVPSTVTSFDLLDQTPFPHFNRPLATQIIVTYVKVIDPSTLSCLVQFTCYFVTFEGIVPTSGRWNWPDALFERDYKLDLWKLAFQGLQIPAEWTVPSTFGCPLWRFPSLALVASRITCV